ncbi:MAG: 16S rRNA (guanine(527)-N(7))-methyltransferase RsmG [Robiginitomaculum sp.]
MPYGRDEFARDSGVGDAALADYSAWHKLLVRWNGSINLVQANTLEHFWSRHALDSHQILADIPSGANNIYDLGSGAGFPGLAIAIFLKNSPQISGGARVTLVESNGKKSSFLRTVIRELSLPARVLTERVEKLESACVDVITARAFAPMPKLLAYAAPLWGDSTIGIFPKGQSAQFEIDAARETYVFDMESRPSLTDSEAQIIIVKNLKPKNIDEA